MPAYIGWTQDYNQIVEFLNDMIQFDIKDPDNYFKFKEPKTLQDRKKYCDDICIIMRRLCHNIEIKQREVEKQAKWAKSYQR